MRTPRHSNRLVAAGAAAVAIALAACSADRVGAPDLAPGGPSLARAGRGSVARPTKDDKPARSLTFVYDPARKLEQPFGTSNSVSLPASAVCDPSKSGYGVAFWDKPCTPLKKPITFTVTWTEDVTGHTMVDFSPDVRFVPGAEVVLDLDDHVSPKDREKGTVYWCPTGSATCVDESLDDSSVRTGRRGESSHYVRRLKHFSGYTVIIGLDDSSEMQ